MLKYLLLFVVFCSWAMIGTSQSIVPAESLVTFEVSNMKFRTVEGSISGMTGTIEFDTDNLDICSFQVCLDPQTISTNNEKRDDHLRNEDFFHTEVYDNICFVSNQTKTTESGYAVIGELTLRGITKTVMIPFRLNGTTFSGNLKLNRSDYALGNDVNNFLVGEDIMIHILCHIH